MHSGAALIAALSVMGVSLLGVIFTAGSLGAWMRRYLTYLATFSAGVFLLVAYHLASEAVHEGGWLVGVGSVLIGAAIMEGIHFLLPNKHHHHGHSHDHEHSSLDGRRVLLSDALHNIGDGILLVGTFASSFYIGLAATIGVLLHEAVQEISEYFVLREAGYSNSGALSRNFAVSSTILIGLFLATYLSSIEFILAILSGIAAGGFLSVVLHDLLPHAIASVRANGGAYAHALFALVGAAAMFGLQSALPHEETEAAQTEADIAPLVQEIPQPMIAPIQPKQAPVKMPAAAAATTSSGMPTVPTTENAPTSTPEAEPTTGAAEEETKPAEGSNGSADGATFQREP